MKGYQGHRSWNAWNADYLEVLDEDGDREYGSESTCTCGKCGYTSNLGDFYRVDQE